MSREDRKKKAVANADVWGECLSRLFSNLTDYAIVQTDPEGMVTGWYGGAEAITGFRAQDIVGQPFTTFFTPEDRKTGEPERELQTALSTGKSLDERWHMRRDGSTFWATGVLSVVRGDAGEPLGFVKIFRDATSKRRAYDRLRKSDERLRFLVDNVKDSAIIQIDAEGRIAYWNPGAERIFGYTSNEILGADHTKIFKPADGPDGSSVHDIHAASAAGRAEFEKTLFRKNGTPFLAHWVTEAIRDESDQVQGYVKVLRDESERERVTEQARNAQKMEALGRLAGGIAHDFNNLLTVISGYATLIRQKRAADPDITSGLNEIQKTVERAARLTAQLLTFSRKQVMKPVALSLNELVSGMEKMLHPLLGEDIDITMQLEPRLGNVKADQSQIEQIVMNLAANARDAMPNGGALLLKTANEPVGEDAANLFGIKPGIYVTLTVSDSGYGMDEATRQHIFEPFFTTKPEGRGTGLGLATSYGIAKQSGGALTVASQPGRGASFKLYLPCNRAVREPSVPETKQPASHASGTILVVEDEPALLQLFAQSLSLAGYTVHEAEDGPAALRKASEIKEPIDVLVTDVVMPHLNGADLARQLQSSRPNMLVLFVSGYTDKVLSSRGILKGGTRMLQKPFNLEDLRKAVDEMMTEAREKSKRPPGAEASENRRKATG